MFSYLPLLFENCITVLYFKSEACLGLENYGMWKTDEMFLGLKTVVPESGWWVDPAHSFLLWVGGICETSPGSSSKSPEDELDVLPGERKVLLCDDATDPSCSQWGYRKELLIGKLLRDPKGSASKAPKLIVC